MYGHRLSKEEYEKYLDKTVSIWLDEPEMTIIDLIRRRNQISSQSIRSKLKELGIDKRESMWRAVKKIKTPDKFMHKRTPWSA